jgi:hypothetical protein
MKSNVDRAGDGSSRQLVYRPGWHRINARPVQGNAGRRNADSNQEGWTHGGRIHIDH